MKKGLLLTLGLLLLTSNSVNAQTVDLLWQGDSYTPPFYKGRALWSKQSRITLVAIPHGLGNPANLNYKWTKTGTVLGNINGVGKNTMSFTDSILSRPQVIRVDIVDSDKKILATASTAIAPLSPSLVIYENNPLYGFMFNKEMSGVYDLKNKEVTFSAFPFFFSAYDRIDPVLSYEWRTNAGGVERANSVTYRVPEGNVSGSSVVRVKTANGDKITQSANRNFSIKFGNE